MFLFDPSGRLSKVVGGKGRGPGEFVRPERMQYLPPDTLAVWDYMMGPVTYFDTAGTVLRTRPIDLARTLDLFPERSAEAPLTPLADGSFVVASRQSDPKFDQYHPNFALAWNGEVFRYLRVEFFVIDSLYEARSLGVWDGPEKWAVPGSVWNALVDLPVVLGYTGVDLDSRIAAGGDPPYIYVADGDRHEIHQFAGDGSLVADSGPFRSPIPFHSDH